MHNLGIQYPREIEEPCRYPREVETQMVLEELIFVLVHLSEGWIHEMNRNRIPAWHELELEAYTWVIRGRYSKIFIAALARPAMPRPCRAIEKYPQNNLTSLELS